MDSLITVSLVLPPPPLPRAWGACGPCSHPMGHSMSPKMFLMQPIRYSCRSCITPLKFLHAKITTSWGWFSSHSDLREHVLGGGGVKGLVLRNRGSWVGNSPSTATLQTGWGVLTHRHKACLYVMLLRDPASLEWQWGAVALLWCAGVCVCVCTHSSRYRCTHRCACVQGLCVHGYACVCACTAAESIAYNIV